MEVTQPRQRMNLRLCQTFNCTANASSTCLTDEVVVCNMCTAIFHYDCNVKIKDGEGFVYHTLETLKSFVEIMKDRGMRTRIDTNNYLIIFKYIKKINYNIFYFKLYINLVISELK